MVCLLWASSMLHKNSGTLNGTRQLSSAASCREKNGVLLISRLNHRRSTYFNGINRRCEYFTDTCRGSTWWIMTVLDDELRGQSWFVRLMQVISDHKVFLWQLSSRSADKMTLKNWFQKSFSSKSSLISHCKYNVLSYLFLDYWYHTFNCIWKMNYKNDKKLYVCYILQQWLTKDWHCH